MWGVVIFALVLGAFMAFGLPNIVTGTSTYETFIHNQAPLIGAAISITLIVIAIFAGRNK